MFLNAQSDAYGNVEEFSACDFRHILDLIDKYMNGKPYHICEIRQENIKDPVGRIDIIIKYIALNGLSVQQKLLILKDELIDGKTFHARYNEWYG